MLSGATLDEVLESLFGLRSTQNLAHETLVGAITGMTGITVPTLAL